MAQPSSRRRSVILEGITIVASILLAFWIDASWDRFTAAREEADSLEALRDDFSATVTELRRARGVHERRLEAVESLLALSPGAAGTSVDSIRMLLDGTLMTTTIDPPTAALQSLVATGGLSLVENRQLRADLARWNGLLEDHRGTQAVLLKEILEGLAPWLRSQVLVERAEWRSTRFSPDFAPLFRDFRFDSYLIAIGRRTATVISELDRLIERADGILKMLGQERGGGDG